MRYRRAFPLLALALVTSCGGDHETDGGTTTPPGNCPLPSRWSPDGACRAPGEQDDGCPAGTLGQDDGSCLAAGIPADACLPGFTHDGELCEPVLPDGLCPAGEMAVMGETTCRPVMPCGTGTWGDLPVDGTTTYVDQSYTGGTSDGSEQHPFTTVAAGVQAAPAGASWPWPPGAMPRMWKSGTRRCACGGSVPPRSSWPAWATTPPCRSAT